MRQNLFRPFEIIKLIRDGVICNVGDLRMLSSRARVNAGEMELRLRELGLIEMDREGNLKTTDRWTELASGLKLSLSQLSPYEEDSVICNPTFGMPGKPPVEADIFVLMPFTPEMQPVYEDHIKPVVTEVGATVTRADDFFTAAAIVGDIWNAINDCRVIIADCTGRNPNVFYEIGIAHTLGKPVVLIAQAIEDIPFDVKHLRAIVYEFKPRGMQKFEEALRATLYHELRRARSIEDYIEEYREIADG